MPPVNDVPEEPLSAVRRPDRLAAVRRTQLLDTPPEESFDRLTRLAAELIGAPVSFISLVDETRDFYKSCFGFNAELSEKRELSGTTFCHYAIESDEALIIDDTKADPAYRDIPTVKSLGVAAYVGIPLTLSTGERIGSFCTLDTQPRKWSDRDVRIMRELAYSTVREIELRMALRAAEASMAETEKARALSVRSEAEIRERHELILAATAHGIFGIDADGHVTFVNPAAAEMLGYKTEELLGASQHETVHYLRPDGSPFPREECAIYSVLRDGHTRSGDDEVFVRKDGTVIPIAFTSQPIVEEGKITGAVVVFFDQTERRAEEERERALAAERAARALAEAGARARDEFFAVLSHELRTPMTSIRGWVEILRDSENDDATRQMALDAIDTSSRVQAKLIDDLLDVTRIAQGKLRLERHPVRLDEIVRRATEQFIPEAKARQINIRVDVPEQPVTIVADVGRLEQVFNNILSNAMKFTPRGGLVNVRLGSTASAATIRIRDTGKGIAPELLPAIFDRYRQAESGALGGLGLGLAIVRHLTSAHGGSVTVHSDGEGKGTTFVIELPLDGGGPAVPTT